MATNGIKKFTFKSTQSAGAIALTVECGTEACANEWLADLVKNTADWVLSDVSFA